MLLQRLPLTANIAILAILIGIPYVFLWGHLYFTGRIDMEILGWVSLLLVFDAVLMILFVRGLVSPLRVVSQVLRRVADGDFTVEVHNHYKGEIGRMLDDVACSIKANRRMMERILDNTVNIAASSFETVSASSKVVFNVEEEEAHFASITTAADHLRSAISGVTDHARTASDTAHTASEAVANGNVIVRRTIDSMAQLADTVSEAARKVESLGDSSQRIGEITKVIDDIAEQTNLLALNAAIEAARAGEHGRGFAVVADEVRNLAERTRKATHEISGMISTIQGETDGVIDTMRTGVERAEDSRDTTLRTGEAFEAIRNDIDTVTGLVGQIATTAEQQQTATESIADSIQVIAKFSSGNTKQAYHAVDIIEQMNAVIGNQLRTLDDFTIPDKALLVAKSDHVLWKKRLTEMLLGRTEMRPGEVSDHHSCRFGKWYYTTGRELYGNHPAYRAIEEPHAQVHTTAKRVVEAFHHGDKLGAQELLDSLDGPTAKVLEQLDILHKFNQSKA